ncbi:hypothetical protein L596_027639 [Steinernema carpocapsae]|uniref:Uncharacterized protein n=1 Tax=Steinernema carpocapsae TaxID=34508 RepID=A0A4U5LW29_STECR|nr:hypothetical protein L596_027639 [Steinernema carpocapsae]
MVSVCCLRPCCQCLLRRCRTTYLASLVVARKNIFLAEVAVVDEVQDVAWPKWVSLSTADRLRFADLRLVYVPLRERRQVPLHRLLDRQLGLRPAPRRHRRPRESAFGRRNRNRTRSSYRRTRGVIPNTSGRSAGL